MPGAGVWLHKRATNQADGDLVVAKKLVWQWSGPFLYLGNINDNIDEIARQEKYHQTGRAFRVHLSKLRLYREPEAYPGQHQDLFKPGRMGSMGDGSEDSEENDPLLQLPTVHANPKASVQTRADHFFNLPREGREVQDEIDRSAPEQAAPEMVRE